MVLRYHARAMEDSPLLSPTDPPPFSWINARGRAPILVLCDHAAHAVPARMGSLGLDPLVLRRHIGWDIGAARVAEGVARRFDAPAVLSGYSRLVVDCNRALDHPTACPPVSDDIPIPGNRDLSPVDIDRRARAVYWPYHDAIEDRLRAFTVAGVVPVLLSIHSFTPLFQGHERPWHFGIMWRDDRRIAAPLIAALGEAGVCVGDNQPYSGYDPHGFTLETHAQPRGLPHVLVEIRQDLIDTRAGAARWGGLLADCLAGILARDDLYRLEPPS